MFGVLVTGQAAQADRIVPEPHVTNNFASEIRLTSTTMEMYAALKRIVEERERGSAGSPELVARYTSAFEKLADYRAKLICSSEACIAQTKAEKDQALATVSSLVALNPGDYRKNPGLYKNSFPAYKRMLGGLVETWSSALDKATSQSKIATGSTSPAAEPISVEFVDGEARLTGVPAEDATTVAAAAAAAPSLNAPLAGEGAVGAF